MRNRIQSIRDKILMHYPDSSLEPLSKEELSKLRSEYPSLPEHLADLYQIIGYGNIGDMGFLIHQLDTPESIYDSSTASQLAGVRIVGDNFSGWCVGYNIESDWLFGGIEFGHFSPIPGYTTVIDLIEDLFTNGEAT